MNDKIFETEEEKFEEWRKEIVQETIKELLLIVKDKSIEAQHRVGAAHTIDHFNDTMVKSGVIDKAVDAADRASNRAMGQVKALKEKLEEEE